jgi:Asp/Glu/hydantoin racemase
MPSTRISFIHTVGAVLDDFRTRLQAFPEIEARHVLDESLLRDLLDGVPEDLVFDRLGAQIVLAERAGAELVVVTCSSTSPGVALAQDKVKIPLLTIDGPLAREAVSLGTRIALVCTAPSTLEASRNLLLKNAEQAGRSIEIRELLLDSAYTALLAGDRSRHDQIVRQAVLDVGNSVDVVVLAQASMAHLRDDLKASVPVPVLASPELLLDELNRQIQLLDDMRVRGS